MQSSEFTIRSLKPPLATEVETDIEWLCHCLGFISKRDKDKTSSKIFNTILENNGHGTTVDDISTKCDLSRTAVRHHLKNYLKCGFVVKMGSRHYLRTRSISSTLNEMEFDILRTLTKIKQIASEIDQKLGLKER